MKILASLSLALGFTASAVVTVFSAPHAEAWTNSKAVSQASMDLRFDDRKAAFVLDIFESHPGTAPAQEAHRLLPAVCLGDCSVPAALIRPALVYPY